jgi:hypothetical protein
MNCKLFCSILQSNLAFFLIFILGWFISFNHGPTKYLLLINFTLSSCHRWLTLYVMFNLKIYTYLPSHVTHLFFQWTRSWIEINIKCMWGTTKKDYWCLWCSCWHLGEGCVASWVAL